MVRSITILVVLAFGVAKAGEFTPATIADPDGFTNVRREPSSQSAIVSRVVNKETFLTLKSDGQWWPVKTQGGETGFMHQSRIRMAASIVDPDGYTFVRSGPGKTFDAIGRIDERDAFVAAPSQDSWWQVWMPDGRTGYMHSSRISSLSLRGERFELGATERSHSARESRVGLTEDDKRRITDSVVSLAVALGLEVAKRGFEQDAKDALKVGDLDKLAGNLAGMVLSSWIRDECIANAIITAIPELTPKEFQDFKYCVTLVLDGKLNLAGIAEEASSHALRGVMKSASPEQKAFVEFVFFVQKLSGFVNSKN